jgi:hypothetical protein
MVATQPYQNPGVDAAGYDASNAKLALLLRVLKLLLLLIF